MQSVSSRIWTRVTVSISYDDNHYTTGTSKIPKYPEYLLESERTEETSVRKLPVKIGKKYSH